MVTPVSEGSLGPDEYRIGARRVPLLPLASWDQFPEMLATHLFLTRCGGKLSYLDPWPSSILIMVPVTHSEAGDTRNKRVLSI